MTSSNLSQQEPPRNRPRDSTWPRDKHMAQGQRASELGLAAPGRHRALGSNTNKPPPATGSGSPVVLLTLANCKTRTSAGPLSSRDSLHLREEDGVAWVGLGSAGWGRGRLPAYTRRWGPLFPADETDRPRSGPGVSLSLDRGGAGCPALDLPPGGLPEQGPKLQLGQPKEGPGEGHSIPR